jgi:pilus assembly protein CpaE
MPGNPILLCAPESDLRDRLERELTASGYPVSSVYTPAEAVAALRDARFDLVVADGLAVTGALGSIRNASTVPTPCLVVAPAGDVEARIAFLEAGADDVLPAGWGHRELEARIEALLIRSGRVQPADRSTAPGQVVTFFSPKGGVGTTTLAVNTALLLAGGSDHATSGFPGQKVLVLDLDLQFGQVATHLNLNPRFDVAGLSSDEPALNDPDVAASYLTAHSTGISVLAAPSIPDAEARVGIEELERILALLRPRFDQVVIDAGSRLDPRTLWTLEQADTHIFVIFPEIAALRATSLMLGYLAETATLRARTHFVVNHIFPKELLKTRDVENLLRARPAAEIPYTEVDMIRAVNEGVPLVTSRPSSPAALALRAVAQTVMGFDSRPPNPAKPERRGLFFGRRSQPDEPRRKRRPPSQEARADGR